MIKTHKTAKIYSLSEDLLILTIKDKIKLGDIVFALDTETIFEAGENDMKGIEMFPENYSIVISSYEDIEMPACMIAPHGYNLELPIMNDELIHDYWFGHLHGIADFNEVLVEHMYDTREGVEDIYKESIALNKDGKVITKHLDFTEEKTSWNKDEVSTLIRNAMQGFTTKNQIEQFIAQNL